MRSNQIFCPPFLILLGLLTCNNNQTEYQKNNHLRTIHLNPLEAITDSLNLSEIAYKVEYIPLQTTKETLFGSYLWFIATNEDLFIQDYTTRVLRFDQDGRFQNTMFKAGRGPGEIISTIFTLDDTEKKIYFLSEFDRSIKIADYNGTFIKTLKKEINDPSHYTTSIGFFNNNLFVSTCQHIKAKYLYSCIDLNTDLIRILYKNYNDYGKLTEKDKPRVYSLIDFNFQITDTSILFKERYCDTVFIVNKEFTVKPKYLIDIGKHKLTWEKYRDIVASHKGPFTPQTQFPTGYWIESTTETSSFLFMVLRSFNSPQIFVVFNKINHSVISSTNKYYDNKNNQIFLKNDLDKLVPFPPMNSLGRITYSNECIYSVIEAKEFVDVYNSASFQTKNSSEYLQKMAPIFKSINEFSNPIIMKVYLK